jgi:hypothetical protein
METAPMADDTLPEEWRPIEGFPYEVSNLGRVRRSEDSFNGYGHRVLLKGRILRPGIGHVGHLHVNVYKHGVQKTYLVHRLVCAAFNGDQPSPGHLVAHRDGDPSNNVASNLYWATYSENSFDRVRHAGMPNRRSYSRPESNSTERRTFKKVKKPTAPPQDTDPSEEWRKIDEWPYEVSSHGRIRRSEDAINHFGVVHFRKGRILKTESQRAGHFSVGLRKDGGVKNFWVHRLVCEAFNGPPPSPKHVAAHGDGNPQNNRIENLRWATQSENLSDRWLHGTHINGSKHYNSKLDDAKVREIRRLCATGMRGIDIARLYNITKATVSGIKHRRSWAWLD